MSMEHIQEKIIPSNFLDRTSEQKVLTFSVLINLKQGEPNWQVNRERLVDFTAFL